MPKGKKVLVGALRMQAKIRCEMLMAELKPEREVIRLVAAQYNVSEETTRKLYQEAFKGLSLAEAEGRPERRGRLELALETLYQKAFVGRQWSVCVRIADRLARLGGLDAPIKVEGLGALLNGGAEEQRTDAELDYYAEHGHWPEEAPRLVKEQPPADPLARLH